VAASRYSGTRLLEPPLSSCGLVVSQPGAEALLGLATGPLGLNGATYLAAGAFPVLQVDLSKKEAFHTRCFWSLSQTVCPRPFWFFVFLFCNGLAFWNMAWGPRAIGAW
jgi:hypothetical protein